MTQKAGTPPDGGATRLLIGIPLGTLIALAIASMIGWVILGLPVAAYVLTEDCPSFFADILTLDHNGNVSGLIEEGDENGG